MAAIYEPAGMAREYAPLACNLYRGCEHGCLYCYAPSCLRLRREEFHRPGVPRRGILEELARDARRLSGSRKRVLFCFTCDPYQPAEAELQLTRRALRVMVEAALPFQVLTKGGTRACRDLDLFQAGDGVFATSLVFTEEADREEWEPRAATLADRVEALRQMHEAGVPTWVSIEPVVSPQQALQIIRDCAEIVDVWKVGRLNHHPLGATIDWRAFATELYPLLRSTGRPYLIKESLRPYLPQEAVCDTTCPDDFGRSTTPTLF